MPLNITLFSRNSLSIDCGGRRVRPTTSLFTILIYSFFNSTYRPHGKITQKLRTHIAPINGLTCWEHNGRNVPPYI